jgi:hypothetical protein
MKFSVAPRTINFPISRFVSENERWEVGLVPVLFGVRVRAGIVGNNWVSVDFCAGDNPAFALELLATVIQIMSWLPENIAGAQVERMMPTWQRRPIDQDPCWQKLQELASSLNPERKAA